MCADGKGVGLVRSMILTEEANIGRPQKSEKCWRQVIGVKTCLTIMCQESVLFMTHIDLNMKESQVIAV